MPLLPSSAPSRFALTLMGLVVLSLIVGLWQALAPDTDHHAATSEHGASNQSNQMAKAQRLLQTTLGDHLVTIKLQGMITSEGDPNAFIDGDSAAIQTRKALDEVAEDDNVKGVLLIIDSPGGTVAMSQELNAAVTRVSRKKPIVASLGDVAASGGYYTAVAADRIIANPGTLTASIGVIISTFNAQELLNNKLGVKAVTIKSGKFKDILSPYRASTPDELNLIQTVINDSYHDFLAAVLKGRLKGISDPAVRKAREATIRSIADGRIVLGTQGLKYGLVDELGDGFHAEQILQKLSRDRFHLSANSKLPMQDYGKARGVLSLFGVQSAIGHWMQSTLAPGVSLERQVMPYSLSHPNQPLWIME